MNKFLLRFETVAVIAIGLFSAVFLVQTYDYGRRAGLFPRLISWFVLCLILIFIISRVRRFRKGRNAPAQAEPVRAEGIVKEDQPPGVKWPLAFGLAVGFFLLLYLIGFGPATVCYLIAHIYLAGYRKGKVVVVYALAAGAIMVLFGFLFKIPLPQGVLVEMLMQYL